MINEKELQDIDRLIEGIDHETQRPVKDGIVDLAKYKKANFKILWILREVNDTGSSGGWDLREFLSKQVLGYGNWRKTWKMVMYPTWGILNDFSEWRQQSRNWEDGNRTVFGKVAVINIKKIPGGSTKNEKRIKNAFKTNKELLFKQIDVYEPDIIILGGTKQYFKGEDWDRLNERKSRVVIPSYHPNQRTISHPTYYKQILDKAVEVI